LLFIFIQWAGRSAAQDQDYKCFFEVGKPCPDFTFSNVANSQKHELNFNDFRGKWLVLDFWHKGCSACIGSFSKHNKEQIEFKDNIQFLLVAAVF